MSVVAYCPPSFHPCISCMVADSDIKKSAATVEARGFSPAAPSRHALRTKYAARTGTNFATTIWLTKFVKMVCMLASQLVPIDPLPDGTVMPCAAIHDRSCGSVRNTTVHNTHFPVRPLTWKLVPP